VSELSGPGYTLELQVIHHGRLARKFNVYDDDSASKFGESGRLFEKQFIGGTGAIMSKMCKLSARRINQTLEVSITPDFWEIPWVR